jgi:hypothetical protein
MLRPPIAWDAQTAPALSVGAAPARIRHAWVATLFLAAAWALLGPWTPDLAAQAHRVALYASQGFTVWDNSWYGGHHLPGYSLTFPAVGSTLGIRLTGVLAAIGSAALFDVLVRRSPAARAAVWWFAIGCVGDLLVGRLTYALGMTVALAAVVALMHRHGRIAVALALVCAATSPVAGLFLGLAAMAIAIADRRADALAVVAGAGVVVLALGHAFPEGGSQPFAVREFVVTLAITLAALALLPAAHRRLRVGAALYVVAVVGSFVVASPMGGNVTRLGSAFTAPLLLAVGARGSTSRRAAFCVVVAVAGTWQWIDPIKQAEHGVDDPSVAAAYHAPVISWLAQHDAAGGRVEVPFTRGHWEGVYIARRFALARGWERQLDRRLNPLFYRPRLSAAAYERWLHANAVRYVALPDARLDGAGLAEAALVQQRPAFLREVWSSAHWRVFAVADPTPLAIGPARVERLTATTIELHAMRPGRVVLRVHWTPYWRVATGDACVMRAGAWTSVEVSEAGRIVLAARFSPGVLLRGPPHCGPPSPL